MALRDAALAHPTTVEGLPVKGAHHEVAVIIIQKTSIVWAKYSSFSSAIVRSSFRGKGVGAYCYGR
jgi:hypothetical protein